jgi:hypothetical protein
MEHLETQEEIPRIVAVTTCETSEQLTFVPPRPRHVLRLDAFERLGASGETQPCARTREFHDERAPLDRRDAADAELRIVAMGEVIPGLPGGWQ